MTDEQIVARALAKLNGAVLWGDGVHDDTHALQQLFNGLPVLDQRNGKILKLPSVLDGGTYLTRLPLTIHAKGIP